MIIVADIIELALSTRERNLYASTLTIDITCFQHSVEIFLGI